MAPFGMPGAPAVPVGPDGVPWGITTRQFRRTIVWHIANRLFGTIAAMIADRARIRTMLASLARTLHVGILADCFFDPGTAVCLRQATSADNKMPLTTLAIQRSARTLALQPHIDLLGLGLPKTRSSC
jgi:hypothetical protein